MNNLIIIPAYNEEESILRTVKEVKEFIEISKYKFEYIVINDGSSDNTEKILSEYNINHLSHIVNCGLAAAIRTGLCYGIYNDFDHFVQLDADGQHIPKYLDALYEECEKGYNVVVGSRFFQKKKPYTKRMIGSRILSNLIYLKTAHKIKISDPRMFDKKATLLYLNELSSSPEPSTLIYMHKKGMKIKEIFVEMREREFGESYLNFVNSIEYMLREIVAIILGY